jgi:hypothetical protein
LPERAWAEHNDTMSSPAESSEQVSQGLAVPETIPHAIVPTASMATPLDAIVLEESHYPYAASAFTPGQATYPPLSYYSQYPHAAPLKFKTYSVPRRFGMAALLAIITALACLFGGLRLLDAPPVIYLFLGTEVMIVCVAQMLYNAEPRRASMVAGAILLPIFSVGASFFLRGGDQVEALCWAIPSVAFGAFAGYLVGACVAGIFLLMDKLEPFLPGGRRETR